MIQPGRPGTVDDRPDIGSPADRARQWCRIAARAAADKRGEDTVILDVGPILLITDAFVVTHGTNDRQVRTIVEEVEAAVKRAGGPGPLQIEGLDDARWVLMDYGAFVVHVFLEDVRRFYDLERLWADAERLPWEDERAVASGAQ
jgi:ribosome-associated protein